jgi:glycosyltransferase involved in cell wall biosynthesis
MVLTVGTLCANKGQMDLVQAAIALANAAVRMRIVFVGSVSEPGGHAITRALSRLPKRLNGIIEVHDATADIGKYYAAADIYVCSSRRESYPRTILEALAFGLPIVATTVDGIAEVLDDAASRSYVPGDVDALTASLADLAPSAEARAAMATSSRQRWAQIGLDDRMIERYARELDQLLANTP